MERTAREFYAIGALPKVIGAIDCTHIPIKSPGIYLLQTFCQSQLYMSFYIKFYFQEAKMLKITETEN